jgi:hypothetical protein
MNEKKQKPGIPSALRVILLFLLLVGLPAGSWFYLQSGLNYRKNALADLKDFGKLKSFQLYSQNGDTLRLQDIQGKVVVANFFSPDLSKSRETADRIAKLHSLFDERTDLYFLSHVPTDSTSQLWQLADAMGIKDSNQWFLLTAAPEELENQERKNYKFPQKEEAMDGENNFLALVDTSRTIRNYYDVANNEDMGRLIEHIAILLPKLPKDRAEFRRQKEK